MIAVVELALGIVKKVWDAVAPEDQAEIEAKMMGAIGEMRGARRDTAEAHDKRVAETLEAIGDDPTKP